MHRCGNWANAMLTVIPSVTGSHSQTQDPPQHKYVTKQAVIMFVLLTGANAGYVANLYKPKLSSPKPRNCVTKMLKSANTSATFCNLPRPSLVLQCPQEPIVKSLYTSVRISHQKPREIRCWSSKGSVTEVWQLRLLPNDYGELWLAIFCCNQVAYQGQTLPLLERWR